MFHIGRAGNKLGSFSRFEVEQGLRSGRFMLTDLGWKEGMETWAPLSTFHEFAVAPPPLPPLPEEEEQAPPPLLEREPGLPWERRKSEGAVRGFLKTWRLVLFAPGHAFSRLFPDARVMSALFYSLIGGWAGMIASGIYAVLIIKVQPPPPPPADLSQTHMLLYPTAEMAMRELRWVMLMGPVAVTVLVLLFSAIAHLLLKIAGGANKPYHVTLRVFCYSFGSTWMLQLLPLFGALMAPAWMVVCCVTGLAAAHRTSTGRTIATMVLLMVACLAGWMGLLFMAANGG